MKTKNQDNIVTIFFNPEFYGHPVKDIELVETHISWVFLTGQFAYKIKKPVDFGFLNFKTLAQRKYYCEQELKLNKRFAPHIYLEVIAVRLSVTGSGNKFSLAGQGKVIDYAIKMKQFDHRCLFNKLINTKQIDLQIIDNLSETIAAFHGKISIANVESNFGSLKEVIKPVEENFSILKSILSDNKEQQQLNTIHKQVILSYKAICPQLLIRKAEGFIRECHGDLHLGNIAIIENQTLLFDGIEFNDHLRWIDTFSDLAFLMMDLQDHNQLVFANHFLNQYLLKTGDYFGLSILKFYQVYRAMVRAKVAAINLQQQQKDSKTYENSYSEIKKYLQLAQSYLQKDKQKPALFLAISFGISGSGKSWLSSQLADKMGAIQLRSDVERKRLNLKSKQQLYSDSTTVQTYNYLMNLCESVLKTGYSVIVDATFLDKKWRHKFYEIAGKHQIPFHILSCYADQDTIKKRLSLRAYDINNISDADTVIMKNQLLTMHQLGIEEKKYAILIDTTTLSDYSLIINQIQGK